MNIPVGTYSLVSPGTSSTCDTRGIYGPNYEGRVEVSVEEGGRNHFTFTVGPQASVQRGPTEEPQVERLSNAGSIEGVVTADAGQPLDGARVRVTGSGLREGATAVTGADGRFVIDNLPPDIFTLTVSRAGFVDYMYGLRPAGREGTRIQLGPSQRFQASVTMVRPGVITGTVRNERGMPMPGVAVSSGVWTRTETDDRGWYRLWPVPAGDHTVRVSQGRSAALFKGYVTTYFPGVADEGTAGKVYVTPSSVQLVDINAQPAPPTAPGASLTVTLRSRDGGLGTRADVYIGGTYQNHQSAELPAASTARSELMATFRAVPAGRHTVYTGANSSDRLYGSTEVVTDGRSPASVTIDVARKPAISLRTSADGPGQKPQFVQVRLWNVTDGGAWNQVTLARASGTWLDPEGRATLSDLRPGRYVLAFRPEGQWIAASARLDGREILDGPFVLEANTAPEVVITFTSRRTSLDGIVRDGAGAPTAAADVLVFSVNREFWTPASRRIRLVRPRSNGRYDVSGLPPGEYAVIAQDEIDADEVQPDWLQSRLAGAVRVTLVEDQAQTLDVRVRAR
jgi:hypothetical protein